MTTPVNMHAPLPPGPAPLVNEALGQAYEQTVHRSRRKRQGIYYTPRPLAEYLVRQTLGRVMQRFTVDADASRRARHLVLAQPLRVLDPACGGGVILLQAAQWLFDWHLAWYRKHDPARWTCGSDSPLHRDTRGYRLTVSERSRIIATHLRGVDLDADAVDVARRSLWLKALDAAYPQDADADSDPAWHRIAPQLHEADGLTLEEPCELVLTNPPYQSFSGRHKITGLERPRTGPAPGGWDSGHGMFVHAAVHRLATQATGFVLPAQVGHLDGYRPLRQAVTRQMHVAEVRYWGEGVFPGVNTPVLTLVADRHHTGPATIHTDHRTVRRPCTADHPWTPSQPRHDRLLDKLRERSFSLESLVGDPGVHTGNCARKLIQPLDANAPHPGYETVLEGRQVTRYRCDPPRKTLRLDHAPRPGEYFRIGPRKRYRQARFLLRQTAAFPVVGPHRHADYFRNSLLALYEPRPPLDVHYLVGLLNGPLLRFAYQQIAYESRQRTFPQVKIRSLRALPIRQIDFADASDRRAHDRIARAVRRILQIQQDSPNASHTSELELAALEHRIDETVYDLYRLTRSQRTMVQRADAEAASANSTRASKRNRRPSGTPQCQRR